MRFTILIVLLLVAGNLMTQGPTPDQLRINLPQNTDNALKLLGIMKRPDGSTSFVTIQPSHGLISATVISAPPFNGQISLEFATVAYRGKAPSGPGICTWEGTGAIAVEPTTFYACTPDANGQTFSWTKFSGGVKTW